MRRFLLAVMVLLFSTPAFAVMTSSDNLDTFTGSVQSTFVLGFTVSDCSELRVTVQDDSEGETINLVCNGLATPETYDRFVMTIAGDGTVTLELDDPILSADTLTAMRVLRFRQPVPYRNQYRFSGLKLERSFDDITEMALQVSTQLDIGTKTVTAHVAETHPHPDLFLAAGETDGSSGTGFEFYGGTQPSDNMTLISNSSATLGKIVFGSSAFDDLNTRLGVATTSPTKALDVDGTDMDISADALFTSVCFWADCDVDIGTLALESDFYLETSSDGDPLIVMESSGAAAWSYVRSDFQLSLNLNGSVVFTNTDGQFNVVQALGVGQTSPSYELDVNGEAIIDTELQVAGFNDTAQTEASASLFLGDTASDDSLLVISSATTTQDIDRSQYSFGATISPRIILYESLGGCDRDECGSAYMYAPSGVTLQNGDVVAIGLDGNAQGVAGKVDDGPRIRSPISDIADLTDDDALCSEVVIAKNGSVVSLPSADSGTGACVVTVVYEGIALGLAQVFPDSDDTILGTVIRDESAAADVVEVISAVSEAGQMVTVGRANGNWYQFISDGSNSWYAFGYGGAGNWSWIPPGSWTPPS